MGTAVLGIQYQLRHKSFKFEQNDLSIPPLAQNTKEYTCVMAFESCKAFMGKFFLAFLWQHLGQISKARNVLVFEISAQAADRCTKCMNGLGVPSLYYTPIGTKFHTFSSNAVGMPALCTKSTYYSATYRGIMMTLCGIVTLSL